MSDQAIISNQIREVEHAARRLGVPVWMVYFAKHKTGANDREYLYNWIGENRTAIAAALLIIEPLLKDGQSEQPEQ